MQYGFLFLKLGLQSHMKLGISKHIHQWEITHLLVVMDGNIIESLVN